MSDVHAQLLHTDMCVSLTDRSHKELAAIRAHLQS